ncbi:hypothetical protein K0M31_016789 [Melipona bicolor]|uniref:Uncharacterized protein n=1 Tax=Melipona bicolor TaxID=60889 RepID=A0AA40FE11_9HYME|nr:hypothetical protein K0M31_016789 [Melipona bicolor]
MMLWKYLVKKFNLTNDRLLNIQTKLAAIYALSAWHVMILVFLYSNEENLPNTPEKRTKFVEQEQEKKEVQVIRIDGFHIVDNVDEKTVTDS